MRYEHTQIGHVVIWALLGASLLVWVGPISHGSPPFGSSLVLPAMFSNYNCVVLQTHNQN